MIQMKKIQGGLGNVHPIHLVVPHSKSYCAKFWDKPDEVNSGMKRHNATNHMLKFCQDK